MLAIATLVLDQIWVNLLSTGAAVSAQSAPDRAETYTIPGTVRTYAGGRQRSINTAGEMGTFKFTLRVTVRANVETLRTWQGQAVQVRDHKGRRWFGTFFGVDVMEYVSSNTLWDVNITMQVVTATEGV